MTLWQFDENSLYLLRKIPDYEFQHLSLYFSSLYYALVNADV
jgi:hypothetical protein